MVEKLVVQIMSSLPLSWPCSSFLCLLHIRSASRVAASAGEAVHLAQQIGYPVAMKICSKDIIHKSDANGVQLNLRGDKNVRETFRGTGREA